jgi:Fe2+ transport system protein FeoA
MHCHTLLPLELVQAGDWAEVEEVTGEPVWVSRMAEMGVRAGSRLQVVRQGKPCLLQVGGSRLSLRSDAGAQILVRPLSVLR